MERGVSAVILLAGNSTQSNQDINKNLDYIDEYKTVLETNIDVFDNHESIDDVMLAVREEDLPSVLNVLLQKNV